MDDGPVVTILGTLPVVQMRKPCWETAVSNSAPGLVKREGPFPFLPSAPERMVGGEEGAGACCWPGSPTEWDVHCKCPYTESGWDVTDTFESCGQGQVQGTGVWGWQERPRGSGHT